MSAAADRGVTVLIDLQKLLKRIGLQLPGCISLWDVNAQGQHLLLEVFLVVTQRTPEEVEACTPGLALYAVPVEPAGVAGGTFEDRVAEGRGYSVQTDGAALRETHLASTH